MYIYIYIYSYVYIYIYIYVYTPISSILILSIMIIMDYSATFSFTSVRLPSNCGDPFEHYERSPDPETMCFTK